MAVNKKYGFTLIELSITLVIIGLLVGGVLVGRDLIAAAEIRSQISQFEKYNTAVKTFQLKTGYLPGDIPDPDASALGLIARTNAAGGGNNDGKIEGTWTGVAEPNGQTGGETIMFWADLYALNLISEPTKNASNGGGGPIPSLKYAKIGNNNIYVFNSVFPYGNILKPNNYFGISQITGFNGDGSSTTSLGLTVKQAYAIDSKIDDGMPKAGKVQAVNGMGNIPLPVNTYGGSWVNKWSTNAATDSTTTCYNTTNNVYSTAIDGNNLNCALSFQFQ